MVNYLPPKKVFLNHSIIKIEVLIPIVYNNKDYKIWRIPTIKKNLFFNALLCTEC